MTDVYNDYLLSLGLAPKSVVLYRQKIDQLIERAEVRGYDLLDLKPSEMAVLASTFPNSTSSLRQLRSALGHWYDWRGLDRPSLKSIRVPRSKRGKFNGLDEEDAKRLVKTAMDWQPQGLAVLFGMYLALRREEIASVRWDKFDRDLEWYTVHGKGNTVAELPVHPVLRDQLKPHGYVWAFPGRCGGHVTPATVWNWVREVSDKAGVGTLHPHQLRHTAIATVNDNTGDLRAAQSFARHASPLTTAIYTRTTSGKLIQATMSLDYI